MSNIRYAVLLIGALSLLLGLSLGQIYFQHQRIQQLEFNRFRASSSIGGVNLHNCLSGNQCSHDFPHIIIDSQNERIERARAEALRAREHRFRKEADQVERRLQNAIRHYNKELELWESNHQRDRTKNGLYRFEE